MNLHDAYFDIGPGEPLFKKEIPESSVIPVVPKKQSEECLKDPTLLPQHYNH
jgi:hypothetical protein